MSARNRKRKRSPIEEGTNPFAELESHENEQIEKLARIEAEACITGKKQNLSPANFEHWWKGKPGAASTRWGLSLNEAKAAVIYEGMRRHCAVRKAWQEGKPCGQWQTFVQYVVNNLPLTWVKLNDRAKSALIGAMHSKFFKPPIGYSTFPDESSPENCERETIQRLRVPQTDDPAAMQSFVDQIRRLEKIGFVIVAVDHKSPRRDAYGLRALKKLLDRLPPTHVQADLRTELQIVRQRNLAKRTKPFGSDWQNVATITEGLIAKRKREKHLIEEKIFGFYTILGELEQLDKGEIQQSDFVQRLQLS